ncbi:MAG TPA: hypothetical protein VGK16_06905 [Candidatus Limnocylindrales bacterium]
MATTTQPTIAHGIARLHPEQGISTGRYLWGPEWSLPPARSGRWAIDTIYNVAIRVEFDETVPLHPTVFWAGDELDKARQALSVDEEKARAQWLAHADQRETTAFVRAFHVRRRREHGDLPTVAKGTYLRHGSRVWHIATGRTTDDFYSTDRIRIWTECCGGDFVVDLGDPDRRQRFDEAKAVPEGGSVCRRCAARVSVAATPEAVLTGATA